MKSPYEMKLDLRVLDHLGIKLYSNAAAVLSEAVANSWDADAESVKISIDPNRVVIEDDGVGMKLNDINKRFLWVGYDKRTSEGETSKKGRRFMGRKGIGKLALFSIADVIEVHTTADGEKHAFRMRTADIRTAIEKEKEYRPEPITFEDRKKGTKIVLTELKKRRTTPTVSALRKRIARRFSIIGHVSPTGDKFDVILNGENIGPQDREDFKIVEFLWEFGDKEMIPAKNCPALKKRFLLSGVVTEVKPHWIVRGWLGASSQPKKLKHDEAGTMNGIMVLARGRLIQENILDKLSYNRILGHYITGQVEADFLDAKGEDDIATSDRQRMIEDDDRYVALVNFLRNTLVSISDDWSQLRNELRGKEAVSENPALGEWLNNLSPGQRRPAERLLGLIQGIEIEEEKDRKELYRAGMLAFERLRLREESHRLSETTALTAEHLLPLLSDLATLEGSLYRDIVRSRLDVINQFEGLVDINAKEKVLQGHLFENLWLLDPGWERAAGSDRIEEKLKTEYRDFAQDLSEEESMGRVDIRYRTNGGEHIIVELKRANRKMRIPELIEQGQKYKGALDKCLRATGIENPHISIVFVLGQSVHEEDDASFGTAYVKQQLALLGARAIHYETLIARARAAYSEYLERSALKDKLDQLLAKL